MNKNKTIHKNNLNYLNLSSNQNNNKRIERSKEVKITNILKIYNSNKGIYLISFKVPISFNQIIISLMQIKIKIL